MCLAVLLSLQEKVIVRLHLFSLRIPLKDYHLEVFEITEQGWYVNKHLRQAEKIPAVVMEHIRNLDINEKVAILAPYDNWQ